MNENLSILDFKTYFDRYKEIKKLFFHVVETIMKFLKYFKILRKEKY